jgi:hypothetical protein
LLLQVADLSFALQAVDLVVQQAVNRVGPQVADLVVAARQVADLSFGPQVADLSFGLQVADLSFEPAGC